jgi:lipid-A-disaccharide synthase-like uncharacterized protein
MFNPILQGIHYYFYDLFIASFDGILCLGLLGQILFGSRFFVQWIASERAGKSVLPLSFWILSLTGGVMTLVYGFWRREPIIIVSQLGGLGVYVRNVILMLRLPKTSL